MAWYPGAQRMELQPESDDQPAIVPTQLIFHSIAAPWTPGRTYEFWRDSTNLESHFGVGYDGSAAQYIGTQTRADANVAANRRPDGTGAVSIETAADNDNSDPWTDAQIATLIRIGVWMHQTHGIPLRVCRTASDPGFGYHRLHPEWSGGGTECPGDARVRQFTDRVMPGIIAAANGQTPPTTSPTPDQEDDVTADELFNTRVPEATLPNGYVPRFIELVEGGGQANDLIKQLRNDLPEIVRSVLSEPMPEYAALPGGYRPSLSEAINGAKTADDRLAELTGMVQSLAASVDQLKAQFTGGNS
nr:hypothetical protein KitaXyl93_20830 [Kitasatospora sp. Xyl93]